MAWRGFGHKDFSARYSEAITIEVRSIEQKVKEALIDTISNSCCI